MSKLDFLPNGFIRVTNAEGAHCDLSPCDVNHIYQHYERMCVIEDVKTRLLELDVGSGTSVSVDEDGYEYDHEKFPSDVIFEIVERVVEVRNCCNVNIGEDYYYQIVQGAIAESIDERFPSYNAEYEIYEKGREDDYSIVVTVENYASVEALKAETEEIVRVNCRGYKVAGDEVTVKLTITTASGAYYDSDEFTVSIAGEGAAE